MLDLQRHKSSDSRKKKQDQRGNMKVICAGMNKTGTKSISEALRQLGFTVFDFPQQLPDFLDHWVDVFQNGAQPDAKRVYRNADAVVDIPGNLF